MTSKIYRHRTAGARFIMPNGKEICFAGGFFQTSDPDVQLELDKVANVSASQIYTTQEPIKSLEERTLASELMSDATKVFDGVNKITGPAETIPIPVNPDPKPTLQSSGMGGGPTAVEKAKAALAARK